MKRASISVVLTLIVSLAGCKQSDYRIACDAAAKIASGLAAAEQITEQAFDAGQIDKADAAAVAVYISDATKANDEFVKNVRAAGKIDTANATAIAAYFQGVSDSLVRLDQEGVLRVKNPQTRARLDVEIQAVTAAAQTIATIIQTLKPAQSPSSAPAAQKSAYRMRHPAAQETYERARDSRPDFTRAAIADRRREAGHPAQGAVRHDRRAVARRG